MKAHRRMVAAGTMALSAALMAAPAYAGPPEDVEVKVNSETDNSCKELEKRGFNLEIIPILNDLHISCNDILEEVNILGATKDSGDD